MLEAGAEGELEVELVEAVAACEPGERPTGERVAQRCVERGTDAGAEADDVGDGVAEPRAVRDGPGDLLVEVGRGEVDVFEHRVDEGAERRTGADVTERHGGVGGAR